MNNHFFKLLSRFGAVCLLFSPLLSKSRLFSLTPEEAGHFLRRTHFSPTWNDFLKFQKFTHEEAVDELLKQKGLDLSSPLPNLTPPKGEDNFKKKAGDPKSAERKKILRNAAREKGLALKKWWLLEMLQTRSPFREKMVLFWHNHFTSSLKKVKRADWVYQQNQTFRKFALGNFKELTLAMTKDPAMVVYLDSRNNKKGQPNENFARELLELFTLGEGNYSEGDIKEAARAFTGYGIDKKTSTFHLRKRQQDRGEKLFLGAKGPMGGDDIIQVIFKSPLVADFLIKKLWKEFVSPVPPGQAILKKLSENFIQEGFEMAPLLKNLFLTREFWSEENRGVLIKSPIELTIGTLRQLGMVLTTTQPLVQINRVQGQDPFDPPNVKGWDGGESWINSHTYLLRLNFLSQIGRAFGDNQEMTLDFGKKKGKGFKKGKGGMDFFKGIPELKTLCQSGQITFNQGVPFLFSLAPQSQKILTSGSKLSWGVLLHLLKQPEFQLK